MKYIDDVYWQAWLERRARESSPCRCTHLYNFQVRKTYCMGESNWSGHMYKFHEVARYSRINLQQSSGPFSSFSKRRSFWGRGYNYGPAFTDPNRHDDNDEDAKWKQSRLDNKRLQTIDRLFSNTEHVSWNSSRWFLVSLFYTKVLTILRDRNDLNLA